LYCRIYTEGLFGIRPTGLHSFTFIPRLPSAWPSMSLKHIRAFQQDISIDVERKDSQLKITVTNNGAVIMENLIHEGDTIKINLQ
jgi:hypothetical protein